MRKLTAVFLTALAASLIISANAYALKPFYAANRAEGYMFKTYLTPGAVKFNKLNLTLYAYRNGRPVASLKGKVSLTMPGMYMGRNIADFHPAGRPGKYVANIYFTMGGLWKISYILYNSSGKLIRFSNELKAD